MKVTTRDLKAVLKEMAGLPEFKIRTKSLHYKFVYLQGDSRKFIEVVIENSTLIITKTKYEESEETICLYNNSDYYHLTPKQYIIMLDWFKSTYFK